MATRHNLLNANIKRALIVDVMHTIGRIHLMLSARKDRVKICIGESAVCVALLQYPSAKTNLYKCAIFILFCCGPGCCLHPECIRMQITR